jgi:hypothetical protein
VFHDNNSREAEAIPHYRCALQLGLADLNRARAWAWLASSLMKTGRPAEAIDAALAAQRVVHGDAALARFVERLQRRIRRA